jgi:hypothetical protein
MINGQMKNLQSAFLIMFVGFTFAISGCYYDNKTEMYGNTVCDTANPPELHRLSWQQQPFGWGRFDKLRPSKGGGNERQFGRDDESKRRLCRNASRW